MENILKTHLNGLQHIGIPTDRMEETLEFYEKLGFDRAFETLNNGDKVVFLRLNDLVIETYESKEAKNAYGAIEHIALDVDDVERVYKIICDWGMNTLKEEIQFLPFWENGVRFFTIEGPNKEKVEFSQML
ncbi:MAG: VOC family protein [Eubacteriales bacterium]|nr:VOC family protein [Eubacteriales bacterium]